MKFRTSAIISLLAIGSIACESSFFTAANNVRACQISVVRGQVILGCSQREGGRIFLLEEGKLFFIGDNTLTKILSLAALNQMLQNCKEGIDATEEFPPEVPPAGKCLSRSLNIMDTNTKRNK